MADSQRKTANLFDLSAYYSVDSGITDITINGSSLTYNVSGNLRAIRYRFDLNPSDVYTISLGSNSSKVRLELRYIKDGAQVGGSITIAIGESRTITGSSSYDQFLIYISNGSNTGECVADEIMLNTGQTALPYEPYGWVHSLRKLGTSTDTITTLPADIYTDGNNATVGLVGNMSQTGTPTPQNPIQPSETGDRTSNLFDEVYPNLDYTIRYLPIYVGEGTFTASTTTPRVGTSASLWILQGDVSSGAALGNSFYDGQNRTVTADDGYITIAYRITSAAGQSTVNPSDYDVMLNVGETALPYEPYGYKIPISSGGVTTPVYLGEVQSTRRVQKIIFTGSDSEGWTSQTLQRKLVSFPKPSGLPAGTARIISSHFVTVQTNNPTIGELYVGGSWINFNYDNVNDLDTWKAYLAQQYAAGTPVCVWYVLATPQTAVVNEPIRKIGDYADTVSDITIPTIAGKDTFDVLTTLKPSEVSLNYTGWHDASAKEWNGSQWQ